MANDDHLNVDLDVGSNELEASLRRTIELMTLGYEKAERIRISVENTAAAARRYGDGMANLQKRFDNAPTEFERNAVANSIKQRTADQAIYNKELRDEVQLQRELNVARGAARRTQENVRLNDGRTVGEARSTEGALRDAITGINTSSEQIAARLAVATGKAMERLLGSTADAIEKSYQVAQQRQMSRNAQLSVPGYIDARVTNDRVAAELAVERASQGGSLAERRARAARVEALATEQAEAARREREAAGLRESLRAREIRDSLREQARDASPRTAISEAGRDRSFYKRYGIDYDAYTRDTDGMSTAQRRAYLKRYEDQVVAATAAGKGEEDARKAAATALKNETAQRERFANNAARDRQRADFQQFDPLAAVRSQRSGQAFQRRYGVSFDEFEAGTSGMGRRERVSWLNDAQSRTEQARPRQTLEDRARAGFEARDAAFNLDGGAQQFAFQARLSANYATFGLLTGAIRGSMGALVEFDENLIKFQAITGAANAEMDGFRANLLEVASTSKFSVNELTQVSIALGQTGLAASEVTKALKPVADLAAASGSTLQESVSAITGVLGAYNMEAGRAGEVADVFVAALNRTKLTMEQLQLGIQYAANIARDSNVSFSELTASIGAIAQAGVKSGSTIGTGMRQLITELSAPTEKLRNVLKEVGIDLADVDLRTQGFSGVLQNLQKAGFGTAEALRSMDLRAAAAFSALVGQADKLDNLRKEFLLTSAATEGAAKANESLSAAGQRLSNTLFAVVDRAFGPLVKVLTAATSGAADLASNFQALGPVLPVIAAGFASIATAAAAIKIGQLLAGLASMATTGASFAALAPLGAASLGVGLVGGLVYMLSQIEGEAEKAIAALDVLKRSENELTSRQQTIGQRSSDLDRTLQSLIDRRDKLNAEPMMRETAVIEAQKAFGDLGLAADPARTSIDELIKALQGLRGELGKELPTILAEQVAVLGKKIEELNRLQAARAQQNSSRLRTVGPSFGGIPTLVDGDPTRDVRALDLNGPGTYSTMAEVIRDPKLLGDNPLGNAAPLRRAALSEVTDLRMDATRALIAGDKRTADILDKRVASIEKALERFNAVVSTATEIQAAAQQQRTTRIAETAADLRDTTEYTGLAATLDDLKSRQDRAVIEASRAPGYSGFRDMMSAAKSFAPEAQAQLDRIKGLKEAAIATGATEEDRERLRKAADDAYRDVSTGLELVVRGGSKEIRERFAVSAPAQRAALNASIRSNEGQLGLLQRQASLSRDPNQARGYEAIARQIQEEINTAREQLFAIAVGGEGTDPDKAIAANPELQRQRDEIKEQARTKLDQLTTTYTEIHRKLQDQLLSYRVEGEQDRKGLLEAQIRGLEKVRDDAKSTPEQMRAAVAEINRLLGEVAKIGQGLNSLNADREALKVPQGTIEPSPSVMRSFTEGSTKQQILDTLKAAGASEERIRYALATGQVESAYAPDVLSGTRRSSTGATGLFQFMPSTWNKMYGTSNVSTDIGEQLRAFQTFTNRNAGTWQSNMGRAASAEELYLMHQQGAAGAMALSRAGSGSALDALTSARSGPNAGKYAAQAITANGGRLDMGADEFINLILRKYRNAENTVGNPFATTGAVEVKRREQLANDKVAEDEETRKAENERKARESARTRALADLKREDRTLGETYETQLTLAKRLQDPSKAMDASGEAYGTLRKLFENAQKTDENGRFGQSDDDAARTRDGTRRRYAEMYSQQGISIAENIGKTQLKTIADELERLEAQKKELERPDNAAREGNTELLNSLNAQIEVLQRRKELGGDYEANQAKIVALEQTLKEMKAAGLDTDKDTLAIRERIRDLTDQQGKLQATRNIASQQAGTGRSYGEAATAATDNFLKSRGVLDFKGVVVDPVIRAQKDLEASLNVIGNSFDSFFTNLASGSMTAGEAVKRFATDILGGLMSQISKSLTNEIFGALFKGGEGGGSLFSGVGSFFSSILGGGMALGGPIRMAGGGAIPRASASTDNRDSRLIYGMPGEYLLRKSAVDAIGRDTLDQVNALGNTMVNRAPKVDPAKRMPSANASANVFVVDRDQVPPPSANEIVYLIGDNIQKGGSIKTLIKRVAAGG